MLSIRLTVMLLFVYENLRDLENDPGSHTGRRPTVIGGGQTLLRSRKGVIVLDASETLMIAGHVAMGMRRQ